MPATAYDRFVGRYGAALAHELIAFAAVEPGMRALDVGAGPGALAAALAEALGPERVAAVEPSETFAEAFRARLPGVELAVASAEALPFPDAVFDAALAQLVVTFMRDAEAGVRELRRVTAPGGVVAACVWDYAGEMTLLRAFWDAARDVDGARAAAAEERELRWSTPPELASLWRAAGLEDVRTGALVVGAGYSDFDDLWEPFEAGVGPAGGYCVALDDRGRAALRAALRRRLGVGDGPFTLSARAWAVVGAVPGPGSGPASPAG